MSLYDTKVVRIVQFYGRTFSIFMKNYEGKTDKNDNENSYIKFSNLILLVK